MEDLLDEINATPKNQLRFHWWVILIWFAIFVIGYVLRFMHWPGSGPIRLIGAGGFMAYSLSMLLLIKPKNGLILFSNIVSIFWVIILFWGVFFNNGYPFNETGLIARGIAFGVLFPIHFIVLFFIRKRRLNN